jgi:hypothetical protein
MTIPISSGVACLPADARLPDWMDRHLEQPTAGDFFATRLWYDTLLAHAMPRHVRPLLMVGAIEGEAAVVLPMMACGGALHSLTGPYSLAWRPLYLPGLGALARVQGVRSLGRHLRFRRPTILELLAPDPDDVAPFTRGLRAAGLHILPFDHVGNWHETLPDGVVWQDYLATREPTLRNTVLRKLPRVARTHVFDFVSAPGQALDEAISAYEEVRARSWKPEEPFPGFDAALLRAAAAADVARIGVLRTKEGRTPIAAQYWMLDRPGGPEAPRRATVLKLSYVEQARAASPGTVLTAMMIRELLERDGVRLLDFGRGDDAYKQHWVRQRRQRIGLVLADPLHPAGLAAIGRHAIGGWIRGLRGRG